jgi:lipopolysaccharide transport system permease protein
MRVALLDPIDLPTSAGDARSTSASTHSHQTVIEPAGGWQWPNLRELWRHRELLFFLAWRDVKVRYKQTALGAAWAVLQPALLMAVFTLVFSRLGGASSGDVPYPLFALAGLLPWIFFATAVTSAANSVVGSERLITKIYFPRLAIPFAAAGAAAVDFVIGLGLLVVAMAVYGVLPTWNLLAAPLVMAIVSLAAVGLGTLFAALNVAYRDVRHAIPFVIQLGMFATPTIYLQPTGNETGALGWLLTLNPLASLVAAFRASLLGGPIPWADVGVAAALSVALFVIGCLYFRKVEDGFADVI